MAFNLFKRKPKPVPLPEEESKEKSEKEIELADVRPKLELVLARIDSLRLQYETLSERLTNIERMLKEMYEMSKS